MAKNNLKVAIVCDWLLGIGGAERVVYEVHKMYPDAPIYTSQYDPSSIDWFMNADIRTTWLQKLPKRLKKFLPILRAFAFRGLDLSEYDLVISISGAEAKGVRTKKGAKHVCYLHAPTHYYWVRPQEYMANPGFPKGFNWLARLSLRLLINPLKRWDKRAAQEPDYILTNSTASANLIKKYYERDATVVHPPVETSRFKPTAKSDPRHGFVIAGRQVSYKRFDLAVQACNELGAPLVVIGNGPEHKKLEKIAERNITFLTNVSDNDIVQHFQSSLAFLFPGMEDFGIVAVEAMAAGTPVVAYAKGGAMDYVVPGKTGVFFEHQTAASLKKAMEVAMVKSFDNDFIVEHAGNFSTASFTKNMRKFISKCLMEKE